LKYHHQNILDTLERLTGSIASASSAEELCDAMFKVVDDFVEVKFSGIYLWDFQEARLKLYNTKGFTEEDRINSERTAYDRHPGWVFKHRKSLHIPDMSADDVPDFINSSERTFHVRSRLWVPITTKSRSLGAFGFADDRVNFFTQEHIKVLELLCRLAGNIYASIVYSDAEKNHMESMKLSLLKIEEANNAQQNFIAKMSHEMRTPLNGIIGVSRLLEESAQLKPEEREFVSIISAQSNHLLALINDVLDISKIQTEDFELIHFPFNLKMVTENIAKTIAFQAKQKGIHFEFFYDDEISNSIIGDELRYTQVINNLLNNALKFTSSGQIRLMLRLVTKNETSQTIAVQVKDTGIGVAQDKLSQIFERFKQADESISRSFGGSGLGLYITKEIINKMKGTIDVKSQLNIGTQFDLTIPFAVSESSKKHDVEMNTLNLRGLNILVVEDNPINVIYIKSVLEKQGASVQIADDGNDAVLAVSNSRFDLVLMDLQMPGMDGITASRKIRQELLLVDLPIIAQSANTVEKDIEECYKVGINDYLAKPFTAEQLVSKILVHTQRQLTDLQTVTDKPKTQNSMLQKALNIVGGDRLVAEELLNVYNAETPKDCARLKQSIETSDLDSVNKLGHKLKSSFRYFQQIEAAEICLYFEQLTSLTNDERTVMDNFNRLNQIIQDSLKEQNET
jgi:signal transduction histidine kinase/CheY-like chemotaxis protein